ncbi:hypothetical protein BOTBODRAFT_590832 [Botryobasidium botryosum FD-172 SS1]|uniref:Uncharacterized protein n=1 Tax=Botryobasidium botryosum (strain FD-172 SS1) TaxID=930990 RepID=A0A067M8I7_BOTB1|nr:hypothetical protein BOTBODRAFT_590832 [Botryobasidium botryosum FD-172 SS1]
MPSVTPSSVNAYCKQTILPDLAFHASTPDLLKPGELPKFAALRYASPESAIGLGIRPPVGGYCCHTMPPRSDVLRSLFSFDPFVESSDDESTVRTDDDVNRLIHTTTLSTLTILLNAEFGTPDDWHTKRNATTLFNDMPIFFSTLRQRDICADEIDELEDQFINRMCICVVAPWNLSVDDLMELNHSYGDADVEISTSISPSAILYHELYKQCLALGVRHFVLTTYTEWIFGQISEDGETIAFETPISHDSRKPAVMQYLYYWTTQAVLTSGVGITVEMPITDDYRTARAGQPHLELTTHDYTSC